MTSNFRLLYPAVGQDATITSNKTAATDKGFANQVGGGRRRVAEVSASTTDDLWLNYDLGSGVSQTADNLYIQRAKLLQNNYVQGVQLFGSAQSCFAPSGISGLVGWWDATRAVTRSTSNLISQVDDLTGNANHATATGTETPNWIAGAINGSAAMRFDGVDDRFVTPIAVAHTGGFWGVVVCTLTDSTPSAINPLMSNRNDDASDRFRFYVDTDGSIACLVRNGTGSGIGRVTASSTATTSTAIYTFTYDGGTSSGGIKIYKNGTQVDTTDSGFGSFSTAGAGNTLRIGRHLISSQFHAGNIGEALFGQGGTLSDADRQAIEAYLTTKWITTPLASSLSFGTFQTFEPKDISGCIGHWSADRGVTKDSSNLVSQVDDQSGNNNHGTATSTETPTFIANTTNGLPVCQFDGSDDRLVTPIAVAHTNGMWGFIITSMVDSTPAAINPLMSNRNDDAGDRIRFYVDTDGSIKCFIYNGGTNRIGRTTASSAAANSTSIYSFTYDGGTLASGIKIYKDGTQIDTTDSNNGVFTATTGGNALRIGRHLISSQFLAGNVCEVIYGQGTALTDGARKAIERYLTLKWLTTTPTLIGPQLEDYVTTFSESSTYRYFWLQLMSEPGSVYTHSKIAFGKAFDFGRDPIFGRKATRSIRSRGERGPLLEFDLTWLEITDAKRQSFESEILKYRDVIPVGVHATGYGDPIFDLTAIPCRIVSYTPEMVGANKNNITLELQEVR